MVHKHPGGGEQFGEPEPLILGQEAPEAHLGNFIRGVENRSGVDFMNCTWP
jgi:hypothetical protein